MATKTRSKADVRTSKGKSGRRPPVKVKSGPDVPLLPVAVAGILLALLIGMIVYIVVNNRPATPPVTVAGIPCDKGEQTQVHYHAALQIVYQGVGTPIPGGIGIQGAEASPTCYYWLHVHSSSPSVIHIESPRGDTFTLGQFFDVWNAWNKQKGDPSVERLDATHVAQFTLTSSQKVVVYTDLQDGKGPQVYSGDPKAIVLKSHEVITIEITPPDTTPPAFTFPSGL
jgi:hypothetical protein